MRPPTSYAETENVHAGWGVYRRMEFVPRGTFRSFPRSIGGTSPPYRTGNSEHFAKGRVPGGWYNASYGGVQVSGREGRLSGTSGLLQRYILYRGLKGRNRVGQSREKAGEWLAVPAGGNQPGAGAARGSTGQAPTSAQTTTGERLRPAARTAPGRSRGLR